MPHNLSGAPQIAEGEREDERGEGVLIKSPDILLALKGNTIFALTKYSALYPQACDNMTRIIRGAEKQQVVHLLSLCTLASTSPDWQPVTEGDSRDRVFPQSP